MSGPEFLLLFSNFIILVFYIVLHVFYLFLLVASVWGAYVHPLRVRLAAFDRQAASVVSPPVSLLIPAYNEEKTIVESIRALLGLRYPHFTVIAINDGSTDGTLEEMMRCFSLRRASIAFNPLLPTRPLRGIYLSTLESRLVVIDKVNGGKSDALNAGINLARTPWICSVDADSVLEEDALLRVMRPVVEDERVVASSGIVRILNGCSVAGGRVTRIRLPRSPLTVFQIVEYLRGFLQGRLGWSWFNGLTIISGAFGAFRTDILRAVGGYSGQTVAEDMEVVVRVHRYCRDQQTPYRILFVPDPVCWTEVPESWPALSRQRRRWQRGLAEVLRLHRDALFRYGMIGWLVLPYFLLELVAPVMEIAGFICVPVAYKMGWLSIHYLTLYLILAFLMGTMLSLWAVLVEEFTYRRYTLWSELARLIRYSLVEHFGFHQLVLGWRLLGLVDYLRGRREWGAQRRVGFQTRPVRP
jgi:cellulose synthase/poly-beta-1,6-N-acetylglucosamine synthase-like glycosyltransferase